MVKMKIRVLLISILIGLVIMSPGCSSDSTDTLTADQVSSFIIRLTGNCTYFDELGYLLGRQEITNEYESLLKASRDNQDDAISALQSLRASGEISIDEFGQRYSQINETYHKEREDLADERDFTLLFLRDDYYTKSQNVKFSGSYREVEIDGITNTRSVDGTTPMEYKIECVELSCSFRMDIKDGEFSVELLKNGEVINTASTTSDYGSVSLSS